MDICLIMNIAEVRESGLLELFAMGALDEAEMAQVNALLLKYPDLHQDLAEIEHSVFAYAQTQAVEPHGAVKPLLMATIDYMERLRAGEIPSSPPILHAHSTITDYQQWLQRPDMVAPEDYDAMFAKIIAHEPEKLTAIVWLRYGAPGETHVDEYEKFLIVEGACEITIGEVVYTLKAGDYLSIPLHIDHNVRVTSTIPCKIILQRVAA